MAILPLTTGLIAPKSAGRKMQQSISSNQGMRFGAAVRPDQLVHDGSLLSAIRHCDVLVPEYHGQWSAVEWRRGDPWFGNYDAITQFAADHGQSVRGHSLIWEQMTPEWARREMLDKRDWRLIDRHFANLLRRYRGRIDEWIVVNEMIDTEDGDGFMRRTSFQRAFGNGYVAKALKTARRHDPHARLMINEYGLCADNPVDEARRVALLRHVEELKKADAPLDMVGIQGHLELAKGAVPQDKLGRFFQDLADLDVKLALTEVDVLEDDRSLSLRERDAKVADAVASLLDVAQQQPAMTSFTTWGLSDRHSWLQERSPFTQSALERSPINHAHLNRGLPFDSAMRTKQMTHTLAGGLSGSRLSILA